MNKVCIIGAGIHGLTTAIAMANAGFDVVVIDKNPEIFQGTSGSTHNRAHIGYHYPRSMETAQECLEGLSYFKQKYSEALIYPKDVYYLISKDSKTTVEDYVKFCDALNYPYEITMPSNEYLNKTNIASGFKVNEPIFDMFKLKEIFLKIAKDKNIKIYTSMALVDVNPLQNGYDIYCYRRPLSNVALNIMQFHTNIIINATYAYSNNILKILDLEEDMTEYILQHTEVAILRTKKYVPSITIMDGPYVSLMPYANPESNLYLLYDVVNSVLEKTTGYFFEDKEMKSNVKNMFKHCYL